MNKHIEKILAQIERYCQERGIKETTFGKLAVNDGKFVARIRSGGTLTVKTMDRLDRFFESSNEPA